MGDLQMMYNIYVYICIYIYIYIYIYNNNNNNNNNIYLLKSQIYILNTIQIADTNGPLKKS